MFDSWFIPILFLLFLVVAVFRVAFRLGWLRRTRLRKHDPLAAKRALDDPANALLYGAPICGRPDQWLCAEGARRYVSLDRTDVLMLEDELRARSPMLYDGKTITGFVYTGPVKGSNVPMFLVFLACDGGACVDEVPINYHSPLVEQLARKYDQRLLEHVRT